MPWGLFSKPTSESRVRPRDREQWPPALRTAIADLERIIAARPELEPAGLALARGLEAAFGRPAAPLIPAADRDVGETTFSIESIRASWHDGRPALVDLMDSLDGTALADRALTICAAIRTDDSPAAGRLLFAIKQQPQRVFDWIKLSLEPGAGSLEQAVVNCRLDLDAAQVASVLRLTMLPALAEWSQRVCSELTDGTWSHGICPICGSGPALAESRGLEQRRHLRCDRCAADWPWQHFLCPFCGTSDHRSLRYVFLDGEQDRARLAICDRCGGRLKVISTIGPLSPPGLLVAELDLIYLDLIGDSQCSAVE